VWEQVRERELVMWKLDARDSPSVAASLS